MRRVFIISDLHLGGTYPVPPEAGGRGFRLCTHADAIARFVEQRTKEIANNGPSEIVLNGDTVDFLAELDLPIAGVAETWSSFTAVPKQAVGKFKAIVNRDPEVFASFNRFLEAGGRLTILLGNHDVELSLPCVRAALREALGVKPVHDFEFFYDGEAYIVGDALIEHGNRYDAWNQIDYDALRHIRSFQSRRLPVPNESTFIPPAGSDMVTSVINTIKREYPFVDLLKPETAAVAPMLLALEPGYRSRVAAIALLYNRTRSHGLATATTPKSEGDIKSDQKIDVIPGADIGSDTGAGGSRFEEEISGGASAVPNANQSKENHALRQMLQDALGGAADEFLRDIDRQMAEIDPLGQFGREISASDTASRIFGFAALLLGRTAQPYEKRLPALLRAMRGLQYTDAFAYGTESAKEYQNAAQDLTDRGGFRYVVFGHTHLAKRVPLGNGRIYFNSGTWADVLRFPAEILASQGDALPALRAFVAQIKARDFSAWTLFRPTYVRLDVGSDDKVTKAELETFSEAAA